jgi:cell division septation protein DedD
VKENAQRLIDQLRAEGFDAELAGMKENLYLVSYGSFTNRADAEAIQAKVKAKGAKAWIRTNQ